MHLAHAQDTGPVAAYSFDEGAGTSAGDSSGNGNTGTLVSGTTWSSAGKFGAAASFDGSNDRIDVPHTSALSLTSGMTLEAWVRPTANTGYRTVVLKEVPGELSYALYAADSDHAGHPSGWARKLGTVGSSQYVDANESLPLNTFSHIAVTFDGTALRMYVNGVIAKTTSLSGSIQTSSLPVQIGGNAMWGEYFRGQIDEVRIYRRALSQNEIQVDMVTPIAGGGTPPPDPPPPDTTPPSVAVSSPANGQTVSGTVALSANASDAGGVASVQFKLDGANVGAEDTTAPYSVSWNTTGAASGNHQIIAVARDAAGNLATSAAVTVSIASGDTQPPSVSITSPANGATVSSSVTISGTASDNVGVVGVQFKVDGVNVGTEDTFAPFSRTWNTSTASNGTHALTAVARDARNNTTTSTAVAVTVNNAPADTTPPTVAISAPANGATVTGTTTVSASASDNVGVVGVQFRLDGNALGSEDTTAPYSTSWTTITASNGQHSLSAVARDAAGRTATASITVSVSNGGGGGSGSPLTIDGSRRFQVMDGFGVNANSASWNNGEVRPALDRLIQDNGSTLWRVIIEMADWEATNDNADPQVFNWTYYDSVYSSPKFLELWNMMAYLNQKGITATLMLNFMGRGPSWMGGASLPTSMEDEWVETVASVAYYARKKRRVQFGTFAPNNELDYDDIEGIRMSPSQHTRVMRKLAQKLDAMGLSDIRLVAPDTAYVDQGVSNYIPALMGDPVVMAKLDHFALHNYTGTAGGADAAIRNSAYPSRNFWMTEVATFADSFPLIGQGASALIVWEAYDSVYNHGILAGRGTTPPNDSSYPNMQAYNTSTRTYTPRKVYYEFTQLFRFVKPGSTRVSAVESVSNVTVYAFHHPLTGAVTLVGRNTSSSSVTFSGRLSNLPVVPAFQFYSTNSSTNMARGSDVTVSNGAFAFVAPGGSIFTLSYAGPPDADPPIASVTSPAEGGTLNGIVTVRSADAVDNVGLRGVQFMLDGTELIGSEDSVAPYEVSWDTTLSANGTHTLRAVARDLSGNTTTSPPRTVVLGN